MATTRPVTAIHWKCYWHPPSLIFLCFLVESTCNRVRASRCKLYVRSDDARAEMSEVSVPSLPGRFDGFRSFGYISYEYSMMFFSIFKLAQLKADVTLLCPVYVGNVRSSRLCADASRLMLVEHGHFSRNQKVWKENR